MMNVKDILYITGDEKESHLFLKGGKQSLAQEKPAEFLNRLCLNNGSTLRGRTDAFRYLTGSKQKPAVLISEQTQILFFPTMNAGHRECIWICYNEILDIHAEGPEETRIRFLSADTVVIPFNYRIIRNQMKRCEQFIRRLNQEMDPDLEKIV